MFLVWNAELNMQKEVLEAIARLAVQGLIKERTKDVDHLDLSEWLAGELAGLDDDLFDDVLAKAQEYLDIVEVHVEVPFWRLGKDELLLKEIVG